MNLSQTVARRYTRSLLSTPRGQAHLLAQIAEAEDNGEARVFDDCLAHVGDPELARLIRRHREDELRHGALFRQCLARTGVDPGPVPEALQMLAHLNRAMGGFFDRPITDDEGVMIAYLTLLVIEERAVEQFALYEELFAQLDPETARVFAEVRADEDRHLKYCRAIARRYAPSPARLEAELARLRELEARAFRATQQANVEHAHRHGLLPSRWRSWLWRTVLSLAGARAPLPRTRFAGTSLAPALELA